MDVTSIEMRENSELALKEKATSLQDFADSLVITDAETYQMAADVRATASALDKRIVDFFKPMKDAANKAHKAIVDQEKAVREHVRYAISEIDAKLVEFKGDNPEAKATGTHTRASWSGVVTDMLALVAFCAANPQFLDLLMVNETALNSLARSQKDALSIPGVKATVTYVVVSKSGGE